MVNTGGALSTIQDTRTATATKVTPVINAKLAKGQPILTLTLRAATNVARTAPRTHRMRHVSLREPSQTAQAASHTAQNHINHRMPTEHPWALARLTQPLFGIRVTKVGANATVLAS